MKNQIIFLFLFIVSSSFSQNYFYALDEEPTVPDTENPTAPLDLVATNVSYTTVDLSWTAATDNVGVVDYILYNNGQILVTSLGNITNYTLTGLTENTIYNITIRAIDGANNESLDSNIETFKTNQVEEITGVRFIIMGASIMQGAFFPAAMDGFIADLEEAYPGKTFSGYRYAGSGQTICSYSEGSNPAFIDDALAPFENIPGIKTVCVIHLGGNNVTSSRPYSSLTQAQIEQMTACYTEILDKIEAKGFSPLISDISFRDYDHGTANNAYENEELGAKPYNDNIIKPLALSRASEFTYSDGEPFTQFYNMIYNDLNSYFDAGGDYIHPSSAATVAFKDRLVYEITDYIFTGNLPPRIEKIPAPSSLSNNLEDEIEYFDAKLLPLAKKDSLQDYLNIYNSVRLEEGDYGYNTSGNSITLSGNQKLYGHVTGSRVPDVNIASGSNGVVLKDLDAFYFTFEAGSPIINGEFESLNSGIVRTTGGRLENNVFLDLKCRLQWDCSASGYFRNNEIYRHALLGVSPRFVMKGNDATPSYGNIHVWNNNLNPGDNGTDISGMQDFTMIGYDVEAWNWKSENDRATIYMRNMGTVKLTDVGGGDAGYLPPSSWTPAFDIEADNIQTYNWGLGHQIKDTLSIIRGNGNYYSVDTRNSNFYREGTGFDLRINFDDWIDTNDDNHRVMSVDGVGTQTEFTSPISSGADYTNLRASILGTQKTPLARPTFETLPDPLGANWRNERVGKTDSTAYIQNLIDTNTIAELPEGVFYISAPLFVGTNHGIVGQGTGKTVIVGLTDDFNLIETYRLPGDATIGPLATTLAHLTLQGGLAGWYITNNQVANLSTMLNRGNYKYLIFREQTYGIHFKNGFGIDNNFFNQVHFVGCEIGFYQDAPPNIPYNIDLSNYIDKIFFWKSQFINNSDRAFSFYATRANNLNSWVNCLFKDNGIAFDGSTNYLQFVNCDFTGHTGSYVLGFDSPSIYNCNFWNNNTNTTFNSKNVRLFGSTISDNVPLFTRSQHFYLDFLLVNSNVTGTLGDFTEGMSINTSIPNAPAWNKLLVNQKRGGSPFAIIDETPTPYPQLLVK
ncbi:MAG: fibronectin type III domain-containing protein [Flaviramulus sp.]|nr:fibronectin type III domain-containing protein [Flaviramulus sp.]